MNYSKSLHSSNPAIVKQYQMINQQGSASSVPIAAKRPEPYISIAAQALVQDNCQVHCGMVRKENKIKKWQDRYLVLHKGCLYYYKDSSDKKAQGQFSLSGYRLSRAPEKQKHDWTFKLTHIQPEKRSYFFAAHSEKELDEWMKKIEEDMTEYCETRRPRTQTSGTSSSEENEESYDYPLVAPDDFEQMKEKIIKQSMKSTTATSPSTSSSSSSDYCSPDEFLSQPPPTVPPKPSSPKPSPPIKPMGVLPFGVPIHQTTVDISKVMSLPRSVGLRQVPPNVSPPPKPPLRTRPNDTTSPNSMRRTPPTPTPKPRNCTASTESLEKDPIISEDMYLELNNDEPEEPVPRLSTLQRNRPDGNSFKSKDSEVSTSKSILPPSALRLDYNKTHAIPLLSGYDGAYMIHSSRKGDINQALSVCIKEKIKHFLIFCNDEKTEYALDPRGPFFKSVENMLEHYYEKPLPNQDNGAFLKVPYK